MDYHAPRAGVPNPWATQMDGYRPVRNWAARQEVSGRRASKGSSACPPPHRSHSRLTHPPTPPPSPQPGPWKYSLPGNQSLVPKRLGTAALGCTEYILKTSTVDFQLSRRPSTVTREVNLSIPWKKWIWSLIEKLKNSKMSRWIPREWADT